MIAFLVCLQDYEDIMKDIVRADGRSCDQSVRDLISQQASANQQSQEPTDAAANNADVYKALGTFEHSNDIIMMPFGKSADVDRGKVSRLQKYIFVSQCQLEIIL